MIVWYAACDCLRYPTRGGGTTLKRFNSKPERDDWAREHRILTSHRVYSYEHDDPDPPVNDPTVRIEPHDLRNN